MKIKLDNGELVEITTKQGKDEHITEYYIGSIKIGVLDDRIMNDNILITSQELSDNETIQKIQSKINQLPREIIEQDLTENKNIEDYINERYAEINPQIDEIRKINLDEYMSILDSEKSLNKNTEKQKETEKSIRKNEELEQEDKVEKKDSKNSHKPKANIDVQVKQTVELNERANDVKTMRSWLGGNIPQEFSKIGVVETHDLKEYGSKNSTRYSLVFIGKDGTIVPAEKYLPQLKQRTTNGNNPQKESYQVRTNGNVEKDAPLSEYELGDKIIQLDNKEAGEVSLSIGMEARNSTNTVTQEVRDSNTTFITSKEQRSVVGEYEENGENNVEEDIKEADRHLEEDPNCNQLRAEDIDGDETTKSHIHTDEEKVVLEDGTELTFDELATRWGLRNDDGTPDAEKAREQYNKLQIEQEEKTPDEIIEDLDEEYEDPRENRNNR